MTAIVNIRTSRRCFKMKTQILENMNIVSNFYNSALVFWNRYQIFVFEDIKSEQATLTLAPDFIVHSLLMTKNYLLCLDCIGNVHIISIKLNNNAQKIMKLDFYPRENHIISFLDHDHLLAYTVKMEYDTLFLCANKLTSDFQSFKKVILNFDEEVSTVKDIINKCIATTYSVKEQYLEQIATIFNTEVFKDSHLLFISLDSITLYASAVNFKKLPEEVNLKKIFKCATEISDIQIQSLEPLTVIIGLKSGSFVILTLSKDIKNVRTVHMNTSISRFYIYKDSVLYSDGQTMWLANILSESDLNPRQLSLKLVKDFVIEKNQIIATTFTNNIYFENADEFFSLTKEKNRMEFYPVESLINNKDYITKIIDVVNNNKDLLKKIDLETNYLLALAISNKTNLRKDLINYELIMYDKFHETYQQKDVTLTKELKYYLENYPLLLLVTILPPKSCQLITLLNKLRKIITLHILFSTEKSNLETTTLRIKDFSIETNLLIPLINGNYKSLTIKLKLIVNVKGGLNGDLLLPTIISEKQFKLNSEYFIKNSSFKTSYRESRNSCPNLEDIILKFTKKKHGNLLEISEKKEKDHRRELSYYIKIPTEFKNKLEMRNYLIYLNKENAEIIYKKLLTEEFLKGKSDILWQIRDHKVKLMVLHNESTPMLKISCTDVALAWNIRKFFSTIFYGVNEDFTKMKVSINQAHYTVIENMQRNLRNILEDPTIGDADIMKASHDIQENIIGCLPL